MNGIPPKHPRLRLTPELYENVLQQVLRRDGWRCQSCGTMLNLEVHHKQFRSHSGHDSEENLITLCVCCHGEMHIPRGDGKSQVPSPADSIPRHQKSSWKL